MKIYLDQTKEFAIFEPEGVKDLMKLHKFPGLTPQGSIFFTKSQKHLLQNVYSRIKARFKDVKYSAEVQELVNSKIKILEIPSDFEYHTKPLPHQRIALRFSYTFNNIGLLLEPGMGKTKVVLDFLWLTKAFPALIICPVSLRFVWEVEALKHRPEIITYTFQSTDFEKEYAAALEKKATLLVINYDKVVIMEREISSIPLKFIGVDEGLIKNHTTERTKSILRLSEKPGIESKMIMSGTLINNSPLDIFSPIQFLEPSLIGKYFGKFKDEYAVHAKQKDKKGPKIVVGYRNVPEVKDILASVSVVMTKDEWLNLPPKRYHEIYVQMGDVQRNLYNNLASNYIATLPDGRSIEVDNPLTVLSKLSQIANGFVYYSESKKDSLDNISDLLGEKSSSSEKKEKKPREVIHFDSQPKAEALIKLLTGDLKNERTIVWFNLKGELDIINKYLVENSITYLTITGGEKKVGQKVSQFNSDRTIQVLVCQSKSINYGVTLLGYKEDESEETDNTDEVLSSFSTDVCNMVFYSMTFSLEVYLQQQDRIHRISQDRECHYWRILSNCSVEERVMKRLDEKLQCNKAILVDIIETLTEELTHGT